MVGGERMCGKLEGRRVFAGFFGGEVCGVGLKFPNLQVTTTEYES